MAKQSTKSPRSKKPTTKRTTKKPATKKPTTKASANATAKSSKFKSLFVRPRNGGAKASSDVNLQKWNMWLAALYAMQGVVLLLIGKSISLPIHANFLAKDALLDKLGNGTLSSAVQHLFDLNIMYTVAVILFLLAFVHALAALWGRARFELAINARASTIRWWAVTIGMGGSLLLTALISGARDIVSLFVLAVLVILGVFAGRILELVNRDRTVLGNVLYRIHFVAFFAVWLAIAAYLVFAGVYDGNIPNYVYYLFLTSVILSFGLTSLLRLQQTSEGKWASYPYAERAYLATVFVLTSAIAWQVYAGLLA